MFNECHSNNLEWNSDITKLKTGAFKGSGQGKNILVNYWKRNYKLIEQS